MSTNYITKDYLVKQLQGFADKLATIYEKQENIQFKIVDKYSDLTEPKVSTICYILNAEVIDINVYEKGFYLYNINNAVPTWQYISVGGSDFELNSWEQNKQYNIDDFVYCNYKLYKCINQHLSTTNFEDDLLLNNWVCIIGTDSEELPVWETAKDYVIGDKVKENGVIYEVIKDHTSTVFIDDKDNWVQVTKEYICCTKEQYDYLEVNDMLKGVLYIVDGIDEEEPISSANGGGSATLTQDITANITVGNITAGYVFKAGMTFDEYVRTVHVSHLAPVVNLILNPSATIYRKGDTIDTLDVIATITKKSSDIDNIRYYIGGVLVDTKDNTTDSGLANGGSYTYKYENTITDNTEIKVIVNDGKTNVTKTTKIEFVNPIYIGLSSDTTLTSVLQNKGTYVYRDITCTDESVIFKYPKSYGELTSIKDSNGFENLDSFTQTIEEIHGEDYYVYKNEPSTLNGFTYTFTF